MRKEIKKTVEILRKGGVIIYPTDTVWGIGCDAENKEAVQKIYDLKKRKDSKAMIVLCGDVDMVRGYVRELPYTAEELYTAAKGAEPLTLILPNVEGIAQNILAQDGSVGVRIPQGSEFCEGLLREFKRPIVSTSANISGEPTPMDFKSISKELINGVDYVVDPKCEKGATKRPSSIIKLEIDGGFSIIR